MSITYTPTTNFGAKDGLPANDPAKVVKGAEFSTEFTAIQGAFATAAPSASPTFTGTATFDNLNTTGSFTSTGIDDNATSTAITIDSSENVNIGAVGTTTLTTLTGPFNGDVVKMDGSSGVSDRHLIFSNSSNSQQWDIDAEGGASSLGVLSFSTNSTERLRIDSAGNVGIGVTDPDNLLTVGGGTQPRILIRANGDAGASQLNFGDASDIDVGRLRYDHSDNSMGFVTSATEAMRIDSSGNVLIGNTAQIGTEKLNVSIASGGTAYSTTSMQSSALAWLNNAENDLTKASTLVLRQFNAASAISGLYTGTQDAALTFGTSSSSSSGNVVERMRIDSSGNVGIGTDSPSYQLDVEFGNDGIGLNSVSNTTYAEFYEAGARKADLTYRHSNATARSDILELRTVSGDIAFRPAETEAMRIDSSGNLLVGTTTVGTGHTTAGHLLGLNPAGVGQHRVGKTTSGTYAMLAYYHNGTYVGGLNVSNTGTSVATSSDVRLKENIVDAPAGNIDAIRVRSFDWKADGSHQTYGMVAQELAEVSPYATHYNEEEDQWSVDYSKLVPMMIKEIQDLKAEVEALKNA